MKKPSLRVQLALVTQERDEYRDSANKHFAAMMNANDELAKKEQRFIQYKLRAERQLDWYRNHIQVLVSKIPGGAR